MCHALLNMTGIGSAVAVLTLLCLPDVLLTTTNDTSGTVREAEAGPEQQQQPPATTQRGWSLIADCPELQSCEDWWNDSSDEAAADICNRECEVDTTDRSGAVECITACARLNLCRGSETCLANWHGWYLAQLALCRDCSPRA